MCVTWTHGTAGVYEASTSRDRRFANFGVSAAAFGEFCSPQSCSSIANCCRYANEFRPDITPQQVSVEPSDALPVSEFQQSWREQARCDGRKIKRDQFGRCHSIIRSVCTIMIWS